MDHKYALREMRNNHPDTFALITASACPDDFEIETNKCEHRCTTCWERALNERD